jgi:hypothetical protein
MREDAVRADRSAAGRGYPSPRAASSAPRGRAAERAERERLERERQLRGERRPPRPTAPADSRRTGSSMSGHERTSPASGPRLRGVLVVLGIFLITLLAAAADSYIGAGLGTITLIALTGSTAAAALMVRRRDLFSVIVAPPLVFVAVAVVNTIVAPSANLNAATMATLLVRGFPIMGIATLAALLLSLFRLISRR